MEEESFFISQNMEVQRNMPAGLQKRQGMISSKSKKQKQIP